MKDLRSAYVRYLPIVFASALLVVILKIFAQLNYSTVTGLHQPWSLMALTDIVKYGTLWAAIGLASRQIKAAACALGVALLIVAFKNYPFGGQHYISSITLSCLTDIFCNDIFTPGLVFLLLCFQKQALRFFWLLCLLAPGFIYLNAGSEYLDNSPYNTWFYRLGINELLKVNRTAHSFVEIDLFYYIFHLIYTCLVFLLLAECFISAATHKKLKEGLTVDATTRYTKTGAIVQFFTLRAAISLLLVGIICHPIIWLPRVINRPGSSVLTFNFIFLIVCALALLAVTTLYYRRFIAEYFISQGKKIAWLFWLVNIPVIGIPVFPFVALTTGPVQPAASVNYQVKPNKFILATLAINVMFLFTNRYFQMPDDLQWVVWILYTGIQLVILQPVIKMKHGATAM